MTEPTLGILRAEPALLRTDLLAEPVVAALLAPHAPAVAVAEIDPDLADTAAFCAAYDVPLAASANCVVLAGKRDGQVKWAAAVVLANTRADVNGVIKRFMDVRKISFAPMSDAVAITGMEYGGITPIGLPVDWPVLVDQAVADAGLVVIGSGLRRSKILINGAVLAAIPAATVLAGMARLV